MTDALNATLAALADPTRRAILARLSRGAASVNELAEPFDMTLAGVSKHIKVRQASAVAPLQTGSRSRPAER